LRKIEALETDMIENDVASKKAIMNSVKPLQEKIRKLNMELKSAQFTIEEKTDITKELRTQKESTNGELITILKERAALKEAVYSLTEELENTRSKLSARIKEEQENNKFLQQNTPFNNKTVTGLRSEIEEALELINTSN